MIIAVTNIDWDFTDDTYDATEPPDLPENVERLEIDADAGDSPADICDAITDALSAEYGFCVNGFGTWRKVEE